MSAVLLLLAALAASVTAAPMEAAAQDRPLPPPAPDTARVPAVDPIQSFVPPLAGTWEPVASLGQPRPWGFHLGVGYGVDRTLPGEGAGGTVGLGVYRDLYSPVYAALGVTGQVHVGQRGEELDGGARLLLESPALFLHAGVDWNARARRTDLLVGVSTPPTRGGVFGRGGEVRLDYLPGRSHSFEVGMTFPLGRPLAGRTRPRTVDVELPAPPRRASAPIPLSPAVEGAWSEAREAMDWLVSLGNFFWLTGNESLSYRATVAEWREILGAFREEFEGREGALGTDPDSGAGGPGPGSSRSPYEAKVEAYHRALDRAFGHALGADGEEAVRLGRPLADRARQDVLEEVILPYNRTIGQYKDPDRLEGLAARARARWTAWLELDPPREGSREDALAVLDAWLRELEALRSRISGLTGDSRMHWLPLALVLRPEEHRTQDQIDALVGRALGRGFEGGNAVLAVNGPQFQPELLRTLRETETYHVLWIHDIRGVASPGHPDRVGFELATEGYLRSLLEAVREYDETGRLPIFLIFLDQHFYELNDGRRWMDLLERPLRHRVSLPSAYGDWGERIRVLQDSLQSAVAGSHRLQAEVRAFGPEWVDQVVKVHVNITNLSDLSFRSRRLLGPPIGADNLLRDHRKIVIRDVVEDDPAPGEVILAGVGVGETYASPSWDDRALLLQGPAAAEAVAAARLLLTRNQLGGARLPAPLRPRSRAPDHADRVARLEGEGADARVLQVHNRTGWGVKDATFVQMLLYDLAPPGTVLYVPDSLWTSFQWMAQLVSAALRGCHVFIVAPALANAPSAGFPQMSVMQELVTRLVVVEEVFGERIRSGGGDLRVGLFNRDLPLDDLGGLAGGLLEKLEAHDFLRELFPFPEEVRELLAEVAREGGGGGAAGEEGGRPPQDTPPRVPQMHRKTQWMVDRTVLQGISRSPRLGELALEGLGAQREGMVRTPEEGPLVEQPRLQTFRSFVELVAEIDGLPPDPVMYFATGSLNKNIRSMALDGEALAVVGGAWALHTYFDLLVLTGGVTWVRSLEEVEALLPPFSPFQRRIGRWLHRVL